MIDAILRIIIVFVSVFAASVPMVAYLLLIWWLDRYHRQPLWMVALVFLWGAVGAIFLGVAGSRFLEFPLARVFGRQATDVIGAMFIAPLVEETAKGCILLLVAMRRDFDSIADGIVFGAAAGLGFGMTENFLYFTTVYNQAGFSAWLQNIYVRTLYSAVVHSVATATFGLALGYIKFRPETRNKIAVGLVGLFLAMFFHGIWNSALTLGPALHSPGLVRFAMGLLPLLVITLFLFLQFSLFVEARTYRAELTEESQMGTLPADHVATLCSYFARKRPGWCPAAVNRDDYIRLSMELASKRHQWKSATGRRKARLESTIADLRSKIRSLLAV